MKHALGLDDRKLKRMNPAEAEALMTERIEAAKQRPGWEAQMDDIGALLGDFTEGDPRRV